MSDKYFYEINEKILNITSNNAPTDEQLISAPKIISAVDPFLLALQKHKFDLDRGIQLLSFLQSINMILSKVFASHAYILQHRNDALSPNLPQPEIDSFVLNQNLIILEYRSSLIVFFLKLRLVIDEIIRLFTINKCDCIGSYFKDNNNWEFFQNHEPFLVSLNAAANFVKHNEFLLDNLQVLGETPCLSMKIKKNGYTKTDYENIKKYFSSQFDETNKTELQFSISCEYMVKEFNDWKANLENDVVYLS